MAEEKKPWPTTKRLKKRRPKTYDWETSEMYDPMIRERILGKMVPEGKTKGQTLIDLVDMYKNVTEGKAVTAAEFTYDILEHAWVSYPLVPLTAEQLIKILEMIRKVMPGRDDRVLHDLIEELQAVSSKSLVNYKKINPRYYRIEDLHIKEALKKLSKDRLYNIVNVLTRGQLLKLYKYYLRLPAVTKKYEERQQLYGHNDDEDYYSGTEY